LFIPGIYRIGRGQRDWPVTLFEFVLLSLIMLFLVTVLQPQVHAEAGKISPLATGWLNFRPTILKSFTKDPLVLWP
jgi:hypothetical protein